MERNISAVTSAGLLLMDMAVEEAIKRNMALWEAEKPKGPVLAEKIDVITISLAREYYSRLSEMQNTNSLSSLGQQYASPDALYNAGRAYLSNAFARRGQYPKD